MALCVRRRVCLRAIGHRHGDVHARLCATRNGAESVHQIHFGRMGLCRGNGVLGLGSGSGTWTVIVQKRIRGDGRNGQARKACTPDAEHGVLFFWRVLQQGVDRENVRESKWQRLIALGLGITQLHQPQAFGFVLQHQVALAAVHRHEIVAYRDHLATGQGEHEIVALASHPVDIRSQDVEQYHRCFRQAHVGINAIPRDRGFLADD